MKVKPYFLLSGIVSVSIYLVICISILSYINTPKPKKYDLAKTTVLELELISTKAPEKTIAKKSDNIEEKIIKKATSKSSKQGSDFKSLFAKVKTKAKKTVDKNINAPKESISPSRFKSKFEKQKKTDNVKVSKLLNDIKTTTNLSKTVASSDGEKHEYFSKIKQILWERWRPRLLEDGLVVKVLVMITNDGEFDYRIMRYSNDERFDESLKEFLNNQINENFPTHKINTKVDIIINFKSEG